VAAWPKGWVCGRSLAGTLGSNPAGCMVVCLLRVLCVVRERSLRRADHLSRGVILCVGARARVLCVWVWVLSVIKCNDCPIHVH
jgi:hypothetical protein